MMVRFYFVPHQDDELTNLGADLCRTLSSGGEVRVVLCTDGSASSVKRMLCNGGGCAWHPGEHCFALDEASFVAARDREFFASCRAMGVPEGHAAVSPLRGHDGSLTVEQAKRIILDALAGFDAQACEAVAIAPTPGVVQNNDHASLGRAAAELFAEGAFGGLRLMYEFIFLPETGLPENADVITPTPGELQKLKNAAACYRRWAPAQGRYAVGYHSVADEFDAFLRSPVCVVTPFPGV